MRSKGHSIGPVSARLMRRCAAQILVASKGPACDGDRRSGIYILTEYSDGTGFVSVLVIGEKSPQ
jgi:hypothetical protein